MKRGFFGRLAPDGMVEFAGPPEYSAPEEHLGCRVVAHGYLADRTALAARFGLSPARASDAELLAHAFRAWGRELQQHVVGEYAAVVYDVHARTALLTHDALGLAPLFYSRGTQGGAFATHLVDLVDETASAALDEEYIADFLAFGFMSSERTPYATLARLMPGHSLWWSGGRQRELQTWNPAGIAPVRCRNDAEYEERLRALLRAGIDAACDPAGPTWISLSGGLDSSTIACVAATGGTRNLGAYSTVCSTWPDADEREWMRAVVERYDLPWHTREISAMMPFARLPEGFHGEPTQAVVAEEQTRVENELFRAHGARVMLTGHAGDAVLCASPGAFPAHLADPLFDGDAPAALRAMRAWKSGAADGRSFSYWMLRALVEPTADHLSGKRFRSGDRPPLPPWLARDYARAMRLEDRARRSPAPRCRQPGRQALWHELWMLSLATATIPRRALAFEQRHPLLYRPLVEFMSAIPWEQKLRPRCDRYLQRRALKGILPEIVRRRASKGNGNPMVVEGLRRSRDWPAFLCDTPLMAELGIVDAAAWRKAVRQASVGQTYQDKFFLAAVAVETWLKQLADHRARTLAHTSPPAELSA